MSNKTYLYTLTPEEIIKRLKNGEVIRIDGICKNYYKMIDGILCFYYDNEPYSIGMRIDIKDDDYYFEEPEEFKVERTGLYKTRCGSKAFISSISADGCYGVIEHEDIYSKWYIDGSYVDSKQPENDKDLVEYLGD